MTSFKKLNTKIYQKHGPEITPDFLYWKKLGTPVLVKEFGPIDYIDFSLFEPHYFAVTCSVRVQVYNPITKLVVKNLSRFRENAYGATFREDGRLICAGSEEKNVKLFDVSTKNLLRLFKGHEAAVHRTFFIHNQPRIASFSDDKSVKLWDIPTEKNIISYSEHADYIRSGAINLDVPDIVISGGYDNIVNMYDTRTNKRILQVNHGSQVESLLFLPSGSIFLSAGGTEIKVWDSIAGGKLLGSISQHHKTITCLRLASDNRRLISSSLDRHVKIYDIATFKVVHTLDYPNGVLSFGVSPNDDTVVAGLVDGLVAISRREDEKQKQQEKKKIASFRYVSNIQEIAADTIISEVKHETEAKYNRHLRKFEFTKALDSVLLPYVMNKNPQITVSVIQELIRKKALHKAICGRDSKWLSQMLRFLNKNITDYRFTKVLISATNIFLNVYEESIVKMPTDVQILFQNLAQSLTNELELIDELANLQGAMHMLLSAANIREQQQKDVKSMPHNLVPSADAQKNLIVNLT